MNADDVDTAGVWDSGRVLSLACRGSLRDGQLPDRDQVWSRL